MTTKTCRSCGAPIIWAIASLSQRRIPLDATQRDDGNLEVDAGLVMDPREASDGCIVRAVRPGEGRYVSHFVTCPNAKAHRHNPKHHREVTR